MVFSEPQPPSGLYKLSTNQQQVPRGSYMNSEEWQELCEGREHVCSSFASSALSSTAHTWQTDHICWGEERTSQQRTISTGNVVFWAFQTRCPSHRPHIPWGAPGFHGFLSFLLAPHGISQPVLHHRDFDWHSPKRMSTIVNYQYYGYNPKSQDKSKSKTHVTKDL